MYRFIKRIIDFLLATFIVTLASPLFVLVSTLIMLESRGPVFFIQERLGVGGTRFKVIKFRTMYVGAEQRLMMDQELHRQYVRHGYKLPEGMDPRITRIGSLLRKTSLDELPQLINVFLGQMSLVGPRPIIPEELQEYGDAASEFLSAKPGLTGYWQVCGRADIKYPERVTIELTYVRNRSLMMDLLILIRTPLAVISRRGAN